MSDADDYAASVMDNIDPDVLDLIQTRINSFIKWDLVRFFYDNPHTSNTADTIARLTGRDVRVVAPALDELARVNVLERDELPGMRIYTYTGDPSLRARIDAFFDGCDNRQFRVKAIYHVIRSLR